MLAAVYRSRTLGRLLRLGDLTPLTLRGAVLVGMSALALWPYGFGSLDLLLFVVGIAGLFLFSTAALATSVAALYLSRQARPRTAEVRRLECGSLLRTGFELPALLWWPMVQPGWRWRVPARAEVRPRRLGDALVEEVVPRGRALQPGLVRQLEVQDAFGLSRVSWQHHDPGEVLLLPDAGRLRQATLVPSLSGADGTPNPSGSPEGDRMEIRPYVPGDSVRNIVWGWFAKTRQLVVRTPERSVDRSRRVVAYLIAGPDDEPAAAAARVVFEQGALGERWAFGADGTPDMLETLEDALLAIARSGNRGENGEVPFLCGLREFVRRARAEGDVHCIVFAPAGGGPWVSTALEVLHEQPASLSFVLGTDGIQRSSLESLWKRLVLLDRERMGTPAEALAAVVRLLTHKGARVVIADRQSGRYYAEGASQALGATA